MQYTVLSRKWRPKKFDQVVGQEHVTTILINSIKSNRVSHAYLFSGPRGTGKTTIARILAQNLNSVENISESLDIIELDGASNRGIDEIRDLRDSVKYAPSEGKYKIFIIDEAHMLTKEAFNALLKTLEEPPSHVVFVLATTESHKIPPTISSRCQKYDFKKISIEKILNHLQAILNAEKYTSEDKALSLISIKADGSLRDALSLLDKVMAISDSCITYELTKDVLGIVDEEQYLNIFQHIEKNEIDKTIKAINEVVDSGISITNFLDGFNSFLRDVVCYKINYNEKLNLNNRTKQYLEGSATDKDYTMKLLGININYMNDSKKTIDRLSLENLFLKYFVAKNKNSNSQASPGGVRKEIRNPSEKYTPLKENKPHTSKVASNQVKPEDLKTASGLEAESNQVKPEQTKSLNEKDARETFKKILNDLEKENFKLFCVLEKIPFSFKAPSFLEFQGGGLSKYESSSIADNLSALEQAFLKYLSIEVQINISSSAPVDSKDSQRVEEPPNKSKREDHPLFDTALNDFKGKLIK